MIKAAKPGVYSALARQLFRHVAGYIGNEINVIEAKIKETFYGEALNKYAEKEREFQSLLGDFAQSLGADLGAVINKLDLIRGFDLNQGVHDDSIPTFLTSMTFYVKPNGYLTVKAKTSDFFPEEFLLNYTDKHRARRQLIVAAEAFAGTLGYSLTYTQLLSMLPIVDRLWEGDKPQIVPRELKDFKWRDNHEYNDLLEKTMINYKILGNFKGLTIIPDVAYNQKLCRLDIKETI